jgi:hypothetical protein
MLTLTIERNNLMMEISALRGEFKKVLLRREHRDDVPTGDPKRRRNIIHLGKRDNKGRKDSYPTLNDSEEENSSDRESDSSGDKAAERAQGPPFRF